MRTRFFGEDEERPEIKLVNDPSGLRRLLNVRRSCSRVTYWVGFDLRPFLMSNVESSSLIFTLSSTVAYLQIRKTPMGNDVQYSLVSCISFALWN